MSDLSNYAENKLLDHLLGKASFTMPTTAYIALFTAVTDAEAGTGTEVSGGSYARQAITSTMSSASSGASSNAGLVTFPTASAPWGTVTHAGIFDASSAGNALTIIKALAASKVVGTSDIFQFPIGDIDVALA